MNIPSQNHDIKVAIDLTAQEHWEDVQEILFIYGYKWMGLPHNQIIHPYSSNITCLVLNRAERFLTMCNKDWCEREKIPILELDLEMDCLGADTVEELKKQMYQRTISKAIQWTYKDREVLVI